MTFKGSDNPELALQRELHAVLLRYTEETGEAVLRLHLEGSVRRTEAGEEGVAYRTDYLQLRGPRGVSVEREVEEI